MAIRQLKEFYDKSFDDCGERLGMIEEIQQRLHGFMDEATRTVRDWDTAIQVAKADVESQRYKFVSQTLRVFRQR